MFGRRKKQTTTKAAPAIIYHIEDAALWVQGDAILDQAHTLIAGCTGCGKSTLIHKLMWTAQAYTPAEKQFLLIDMKGGVELGRYARLPHTVRFARTLQDALSALDYAQAIMADRIERLYQTGATLYQGADLYVVIDELAFLLQAGGQDALRRLIDISQRGRAARVHLILASQDPSRRGIPAALQANMTCCIGLKCKTAIESRQIIGLSGCESLPRYGMAYMVMGPDVYNLPITPETEETYAERIAYWLSPACVTYKKGA